MKKPRRRSHSTARRVKNFARWWRLPDQNLLRHEARWGRRLLLRPPGIFLLLLPLAIKLLADGLLKMADGQANHTGALVAAVCLRHMAVLFVVALLWRSLMQQRTFLLPSRQKMHDLALSLYGGRQLWPALIAAPIVVPASIMTLNVLLDVPGLLAGGFVARELLAVEFFLLFVEWIGLVLFTTQIAAGCFSDPNPLRLFFAMGGYGFQFALVFGSMLFLTCCIATPALALADGIEQDGIVLHLCVAVAGAVLFLCFAVNFYLAAAKYNLQQLRQIDLLEIYRERYETPGRNRF